MAKVLYNGEAIFGVINFGGDTRAGKCQAETLARRARALGAPAQCQAYGRAVLGSLSKTSDPRQLPSVSQAGSVSALGIGEIYDRERTGEALRGEPQRSSFLANGYRATGTKFLHCLDGTFAAAFWDDREEQLVLACDRRADAHVYYRVKDGQLVFSSSLPILVDTSDEIDCQAVQEFLRFLYIAPPRTIYRGIARLEPGHYLTSLRGDFQTQALSPEIDGTGDRFSHEDAEAILKGFEKLYHDAVRNRIGQRRVGIFLSSGIDSATLAAICQSVNPGAVEAFTVGFDDSELDETSAARSMARHIGVPHTDLLFELKQYRRAFDLMVEGFEQPFADPAGLPLILAGESAKNRVDVISGGVGGDDLFSAPIPRHLRFSTVFSAKLPRFLRKSVAASLKQCQFAGLSNQSALFDFDDPEELFVTWSGWSRRELENLLGAEVSFNDSGFYRTFRAHQKKGAQQLYDALAFFPPDDCRFEAAALMNMPVEMPYHDANLNAYVRNLPQHYRFSDASTKILLRQLFRRYFPDQLLSSKKHYFNIPLQALLADRGYELVHQYLGRDCVQRAGLVDPSRVEPWIRRFLAGDESLRFKVWALLVLHAWVQGRKA